MMQRGYKIVNENKRILSAKNASKFTYYANIFCIYEINISIFSLL